MISSDRIATLLIVLIVGMGLGVILATHGNPLAIFNPHKIELRDWKAYQPVSVDTSEELGLAWFHSSGPDAGIFHSFYFDPVQAKTLVLVFLVRGYEIAPRENYEVVVSLAYEERSYADLVTHRFSRKGLLAQGGEPDEDGYQKIYLEIPLEPSWHLETIYLDLTGDFYLFLDDAYLLKA